MKDVQNTLTLVDGVVRLGVTSKLDTHCAIIACMLLSLWTGRKPTLRTYEMVCYYFIGLAEEEELLAHLAKLKAANS